MSFDEADYDSETVTLLSGMAGAFGGMGLGFTVDVGETCLVHALGAAELFTGKPVYLCCVMWGFESLSLPDGSVVEVVDVEPTDPSIVTVRVLNCYVEPALENLIGTVRASWLKREHRHEALADGMQIRSTPRKDPVAQTQALSPPVVIQVNSPDGTPLLHGAAGGNIPPIGSRRGSRGSRASSKSPSPATSPALGPSPRRKPSATETLGSRIIHILHLDDDSATQEPEARAMGGADAMHADCRDENKDPVHVNTASPTRKRTGSASQPPPFHFRLTEGVLRDVDMLKHASLFEAGHVQFPDIMPMFVDGNTRVLSGDVVRAVTRRVTTTRFDKMTFLGTLRDTLVDLTATGRGQILLNFDFGGDGSSMIEAPSQEKMVLVSRHSKDPYLVHPKNKPKMINTSVHRFLVKDTVSLNADETGIQGAMSGDLQYAKAFLKFNCDIRTVHRVRRIEYDEGRPFIRVDRQDRPIIENNHYVPHTYTDWLVILVLGRETWIGIPPLSGVDANIPP